MTGMDVSLRLRLENQLSRPADQARRDLNEVRQTAERLGRTKAGEQLGQGLRQVGSDADKARERLGQLERSARAVDKATGQIYGGSLAKLKVDAGQAEWAIRSIKSEATELKAALGNVDNNAFAGLKSDATQAETAIGRVAQAVANLKQKLTGVNAGGQVAPHTGAPYRQGASVAPRTGIMSAIEGAADQIAVPLAVTAGGAYLMGAVPAGVAVAGVATVKAAANDEQRSDALRVTGEYDAAEQRRIDAILGRAGAVYGVGTAKAQETFGTLISNGVEAKDAATMTEGVIKVGKATNADPVDVAGTTVSMREIMGLKPSDMPAGYESIAVGGKMGKFEVKDMAQHGPSLFAAMAGQGSTGLRGVRLTSAMVQSIAREAGSNDQAKTSYEAMLTDMVSPDVAGRFEEEYGQNIYQIRKDAIAAGKDPVLESLRAYQKAVQGDEEKTRSLFRNSEAYKGYNAVFKDLDLIVKRREQMENAGGVIDGDYGTNTDNLNSQTDRVTAAIAYLMKRFAEPVLPVLTEAMRGTADNLMREGERPSNQDLFMQEWRRRYPNGANKNGPSLWQRFLYGKGADADFSFRDHLGISRGGVPIPTERPERPGDLGRSTGQIPVPLARPQDAAYSKSGDVSGVASGVKEKLGIDMKPAAEQSMQAYRDGLIEQGKIAEGDARGIVERLMGILNFHVSPTITPTIVDPGQPRQAQTAADPQKHTSLQQSSNIRLTQNITTPNPKLAALKARRDQARAIQQARARSLHDVGRGLA
ncbi:phage tail tape measure protein [Rhizobium lemnae]|uniref:Phage tail tape measure protein n=1 Tax=Rhizobium lemnae TaxID=1214924 RepID=A0ABV8E4T2_9HYPH|nr:phage tail tape measure protein [Rhizobium lemnae]MCJ8506613.1 phage tail tape measure protein [Rhizobium lemnae]